MFVLPGNTYLNHTVNAVHFDGTNDYLSRGADLTGSANSKLGILSCWAKFTAGGSNDGIVSNEANNFLFYKTSSDGIRIQGSNPGTVLQIDSATTYDNTDGWIHIAAAWDLANGVAQIYINGADDLKSGPTIVDTDIDYTRTDWLIGALNAAGNKLNGDLAQLYLNIEETIDLSVATNLAKLYSRNQRPVDLGAAGATPTGTAPRIFLNGATSTWHTNLGTGGGFTENGALTDASTSPSDL